VGARWPWHAICENEHITSGFSGGSDGVCNECEAAIIDEHNCWDYGLNQECETDALSLSYREFDNNRRQLRLF
jgi:hypothetical protein